MKDFLNSFGMLTKDELKQLDSIVTTRKIAKGELIIPEGNICNELYFIKTGIVRSYYTTDAGEEMTYCITFGNTFMTALSSLISNQPTAENLQAVTATELDVIQKADLEKLYTLSPNWLRVGKYFIEQEYLEMEKRFFSFQKDKGKERYRELLQKNPEYIMQIPLQYLASYLGVTPRHLSRLRREVSL